MALEEKDVFLNRRDRCGHEFEPGRGQKGSTDYCPALDPQHQQLKQQHSR